MKSHIKNVILVMSGGVGSRFGADCPKQYCMMGNRMCIDYVMDACRKTKGIDAIVVVAAGEYVDFCNKRFGVPSVQGGTSRPESVANGLKYIHDNYDCEKVIITNAVCPLATSSQYERYLNALDDYDYVLTTWKLAPALHKFDGTKVDRDDYFNVMEPDAYRFKKLYENFDFENKKKYIFHNMPDDSKPFFCMDYPFTNKLTHPHDIKILSVLYDELVLKPDREKAIRQVSHFLAAGGKNDVIKWIYKCQEYIEEFKNTYKLTSYNINAQTEENIVYEAQSIIHGDIIIKFTPSDENFHKEYTFYKLASKDIMCEMIDCDKEYNAIVLKMLKPGFQVRINVDNPEIQLFFERVSKNLIPESALQGDMSVPNVYDEFFIFQKEASKYTYEYFFRQSMERKALKVWEVYFKNAKKYYLHRDYHKRNLLKTADGIKAIDPRGAIGPAAFEYVIQFIIELREYPDRLNKEEYKKLFNFFSQFIDEDELRAALFFFWVYKMDDYSFHKKDNYKLANWCKSCLVELYFNGIDDPTEENIMPQGLKKLS